MSTFSSMFLRALRVCSPEFLQEEFVNIFNISEKLKYPRHFIERALTKAQKTFYSNSVREPFNNQNLLVLPYNKCLENVPKFCKNFNIKVIFRYSNTLKSLLIRNSPRVSHGCIYRVPCMNCNCFYIGQSGKGLETRIKQHKYSVRMGQMSNALFLHVNDFNHRVDWDGSEVILYCDNIVKRNVIESALIKSYNGDLLNISQGIYKLDSFVVKRIIEFVAK